MSYNQQMYAVTKKEIYLYLVLGYRDILWSDTRFIPIVNYNVINSLRDVSFDLDDLAKSFEKRLN